MQRLQFLRVLSLSVLLCSVVSVSFVSAREWKDKSGKFSVQAEYLASDESQVVIRNEQDELLVVQLEELSEADRQFIREQQQEAAGVTPQASTWNLRGGGELQGKARGFNQQKLTLERVRGDVYVNDRKLSELPEAYQRLVPRIVAQIDETTLQSREDLDKYVAKNGGGPFGYQYEGLELVLDGGVTVTVPLALLQEETAADLRPGFERWKNAQMRQTPDAEREDVEQRERLMIDSYSREQQRARAARAARANQNWSRRMKVMQLQLLAAETGLVDLWEVMLLPPNSYGYPYYVVVPARNSLIAQRIAMQRYPGWRMVGIREAGE